MKYIYNKEFIPGQSTVYYSGPYWDDEEVNAAVDALKYGSWLTAGENVREFEREFSRKFNVVHSLMVNSGSSANLVLIAALKKHFGWADGDEIIVSPVGFPATISVIYQNRLKPVFADIEWDTLNFDLDKVEAAITDRTRAIFLSPVLGNPPHMEALEEICAEHEIHIVLDGCDSLGSKWGGYHLNDFAIGSSCSFYPAHHITTGEGGMVSFRSRDLHRTAVSIAWWGRDCYCVGADNLKKDGSCGHRFSKWLDNYDKDVDHKYVFSNMGYNLKPLDLQGAIGRVQLTKFDEIERKRKENAARIRDIVGLPTVKTFPEADVSWFGVPLITDRKHELVAHLEANKIQTRNYFAGNILLHPGYSFLDDYRKYPEANKVLDRVFFVGCAPHYDEKVFDYIAEVMSKWQ